jgi:hypothetical protein
VLAATLAASAACNGCSVESAEGESTSGAGGQGGSATTTSGTGAPAPARFSIVEGLPEPGPSADVLVEAGFDGYATSAAATDALVGIGTTLGVLAVSADGASALPLVGNEPDLPAEVGLVHAMAPFDGGLLVASDTGLYVAKDGIVTRSAGHDALDPLGILGLATRSADDDGDGDVETTIVLRTEQGLHLSSGGALERWSVEGEEGAPSAALLAQSKLYVAYGDRSYVLERSGSGGVRIEHPLGSVRAIACSTALCGEGAVVHFATDRGLVERTDDDRYTLYTLAPEGAPSGGIEAFAFDASRQRVFAATPQHVVRVRTAALPLVAFERSTPTLETALTTDKQGDLWLATGGSATKLATGTPLSFAVDVQPIMSAYCATCHREGKKGAPRLALETYDGMTALVDVVLERIQDGSMPPSTYPSLPAEQLQILIDWSANQAP